MQAMLDVCDEVGIVVPARRHPADPCREGPRCRSPPCGRCWPPAERRPDRLELEPATAEVTGRRPHWRRGREQLLFVQSAIELGDRLAQRAQQLEENAGRLIVAAVQADRTPREPAADIVQEVRVAGPDGHDKPRRAQQMHLEQPAGRADQPRDRAQPLADLHPAGLAESLEPAVVGSSRPNARSNGSRAAASPP